MNVRSRENRNILFVCDFPFARAGGVGRVTETLAGEFMRRGHGVAYLAFCAGQECVTNGVAQYFVPDARHISAAVNIQYVVQLLSELCIDVIINQAGAKIEVLKFFTRAGIGKPILSVHHNCVQCLQDNYQHIITENFKRRKFFMLLDHRPCWFFLKVYHRLKQGYLFSNAIRVSDRLVLLSDVFVPEMKTYIPEFPLAKVIGIPNPAPFSIVDGVEAKKENRLVFVGRVNYLQKRADLLLGLWKRIYLDFPGWHFDIVGDGKDRKELEGKVTAENLERIHFHGVQDPRPYLEKAKFFCMTSAFEGYPMVLVEALAYGVIPFAFNSFSALNDIIQVGENGYVFPKFDLDRYADALKELMSDEKLRQEIAAKGQASIAKFHPAFICDAWVRVFDELVK